MEQLTRTQAQRLLDEWAAMMRDRDRRVILAAEAGETVAAIARRLGIARNTVYDILRKHREQAQ